MFKKIALLGTICVLASAMSASADTIFSLTTSGCSSGCNVLPAGTVTLHQNGTNDVFVTVQLGPDYSFRQANDSNHHGFAFNLSGVSGVGATNVSSPFAFEGFGSYNDSPFGTFQYDFECTTCGAGVPVTPTQTLTFDLIGLGLLESSFVSNGSGFFFAADVWYGPCGRCRRSSPPVDGIACSTYEGCSTASPALHGQTGQGCRRCCFFCRRDTAC